MSKTTKTSFLIACCGAFFAPSLGFCLSLSLPENANRTFDARTEMGSYELPLAVWQGGKLPTQPVEGVLTEQAWQIPTTDISTLELLAPLRDQLIADGYQVLLDCETRICGGFDFRYHTRVLDEPAMHVDLGDFRALTARKGAGDVPEYISILVSRSRDKGYVQIIRIGPENDEALAGATRPVTVKTDALTFTNDGPIEQQLGGMGRAVLEDLEFETGSANLAQGDYSSLEQLAGFLRANPSAKIALVGHTDAEGTMEGNINLSRKRAQSVMDLLVSAYQIAETQLQAQGVGYLAPLAANQTDAGRKRNRRVEAILLTTQ